MKRISTLLSGLLFSMAAFGQSFVKFEAESGTRGAEWTTATIGSDVVVRATTNAGGGSPGSAARVITYAVTFPQAGTYSLYARIRVNAGAFDDDSYFYGNGFGSKTPSNDNDWILANGLASAGFTLADDMVDAPGTAGSNVFKWVNMSVFNGGETPITFNVPAGSLSQTFQIGAREDGLDIDKFVFGLTSYTYTVGNLNNGENGSNIPPPPPYVPPGPPIASGKPKFLGGVYSNAQKVNFNKYWNQVTPENGGKWGSVEGTRDVMNWAELDSAYKLAKDNGFPFKLHTLIWGSQQPAWIESLPANEQLEEIKEWFAALAARYPAIDYIEVVNEPLHQAPDANHSGKYINALGGNGTTGWDWVLESFRLARQYFPTSKLWINDYSIINSTASTNTYMTIINLLKAENLVDGIGEQGHAFTTFNTPASTLQANLNTLATAGLPLYITELDIDGAPVRTTGGDNVQLAEYQRVFPLFWEHPAVQGITLWGYRPGHWRSAQGAYLAYDNGAERPALVWLRQYVENAVLPVKLSYFEVTKSNNKVSINWATANELNNDKYVVERSADGRNYVALATVRAGNAVDDKYVAVDEKPLKGINYYRLVQYDKDGRATFFGVRTVRFETTKMFVQLYPNPASSYFMVRADADDYRHSSITIDDVFGRRVATFAMNPSGAQTISTDKFAAGVYFVTVHASGTTTTSRIVIKK